MQSFTHKMDSLIYKLDDKLETQEAQIWSCVTLISTKNIQIFSIIIKDKYGIFFYKLHMRINKSKQ